MAKQNRDTLKDFFQKGKFPSAIHFGDLIDSTVNMIDDGYDKSKENGLELSAQVGSKKLMSFFENMIDVHPVWQISLNKDDKNKGLSIDDSEGNTRLFLKNNGYVGINTNNPNQELSVDGFIGMKGRVGTFKYGKVKGDGEWHPILEDLDGIQAFEVVARIDGPPKKGKYAITHAIALSAYGSSDPMIEKVQTSNVVKKSKAWYGWGRNQIDLRWSGETHKFQLEIRTRIHYGLNEHNLPYDIKYHITELWDEKLFEDDKNFITPTQNNENEKNTTG